MYLTYEGTVPLLYGTVSSGGREPPLKNVEISVCKLVCLIRFPLTDKGIFVVLIRMYAITSDCGNVVLKRM